MASPSKDATPMWDIVSPEDDKEIMEKFTAESNKVINRWSQGGATFAEKDAAFAFLVQLGAVQITIQSGSQQTTSQKEVSILFGDGEDLKTSQERGKADPGDTKDTIPREGNSVTPAPDSSDQNAEQLSEAPVSLDQDTKKNREAQVIDDSNDDDDEDNNYSVWMTEPDDGDDDDNQIPEPAPVVEKRSTTPPRAEHPCPDCHTVLHSMWELDLHKLRSCTTKTPHKHVYNCDQCCKSFSVKVHTVTHLRKVHNMSPTKAVEKLADLKSKKRQNRRKVSESRQKRITSNRDLNKTSKKKAINDLRRESKISKVEWKEKGASSNNQGAKQQKQSGTKRKVRKRSYRYLDENVPRQSKRLLVKLQPLANGWIKILESETVDVSRLTSNSLSNEPHGTEAVFIDKRPELIHTSIEHQKLNSYTENDTSSPMSEIEPLDIKEERETSASVPIQGDVKEKICSTMAALESSELEDHGCIPEQVREKQKENSMREEEPLTADRERETAATMPMPQSQNSEAEVEEKSGRKSTELLSDEHQYQGCSGKQVRGENQDASSAPHIERDPEVNEIHETTYEPNEKKNLSEKTEKETKEANSVSDGDNDNNVTNTKPAKSKKIATTCKFCDLQFKSNYHRKQHVLKIHTEDVQEYRCSTCNRSFIDKRIFKTHLKTHMDINEREKYHCKMCKKSFLIKYTYQKHKKSHAEKPETFRCETCGKVLATKRSLDSHINTQHKKEILYTCEVCGKNFYYTGHIQEHLETHKEKRTWECDQCGATFFRESRMKIHQKIVHTTRQCLCEICGSAFKTPGNLRQHHRTAHTNVYKFSCDVCGKKFKRSTHLNAHVKIHSNDPKDKPFKCEICSKCFRMRHKLKVHMDWHNNVRSYSCHHCGKSFLTKGNLDKHQYIHTSKKPHECRICSQGFVDLPGLRKHLDIKHQITLKKRVTEGVRDERVDKGSAANHLSAHKLEPSSHLSLVSDSEDRSEVGDVGHLEISDDVPQLSEASDSQIVREALLAMMND